MFIKDIILDGFKCYENKTVLRNLDKSYNAITGLNGSGKSNVIDAIVFSLGLETKKILRATTLKDLINVHRKDCKVTLVFNNLDKDKSPPGYKDYDELTITRSLDSTGKSKFYLNNHTCTNSTISKLCSSIGINAEKGEFFFIIMQGHITKILNMKSKEIGTLIEETAGTRSYTKEKEKALQVMEKKEIKLKEAKDAMERRISPFYDRLIEEREAFVEQKNLEEKKNKLKEEIESVKKSLEENEACKLVENLKECLEVYNKDIKELKEVENKLEELQEEEDVVDNVGFRDLLEDEKMKLETLKEKDLEREISKLREIQNNLKIISLKEKEKIILENLKNTEGIFKDLNKLSKIEELTNLKNEKVEIEYKLKSLKVDNNYSEEKIVELSNLKVDEEDLKSKIVKLNYLKSKINYPFLEGVFGSVGENVEVVEERHREAINTIMGNKARHIIVQNEVVGGNLLKTAERRISVIPLNKIKTKPISFEVSKKIKSRGGKNAIDLVKFDLNLKKAIEHVFSNFYVFEKKEEAKKVCYDFNVYCITLDGVVYDPKGTVTGGRTTFKVEIVSRKEIESLEKEVEILKTNSKKFKTMQNEYEKLIKQRELIVEQKDLKDRLKGLEVKISTLNRITGGGSNLKEELDSVRKKIIQISSEEKRNQEILKRKEKIKEDIESLEKKKDVCNREMEECRSKIETLQDKLRVFERKTSTRRMSEKQAEGLEPKKKHLVRVTTRNKNWILKVYNQLREKLGEEGEVDDLDLISLNVSKFNFNKLSEEEENSFYDQLLKLKQLFNSLGTRKSIRMDPSNFNLLEKYDLDIQMLKDKIVKIEKDKKSILMSITSFDTLGVKEIEKAFNHINKRLGAFLRYFIPDSDAKIVKEEEGYELKVKVGNWKDSLTELSGGQRSLVALCLVFSMLTYRPAPFYIFDEIDAALDLSYTQSIGEIIKREFDNAQFVIISLKNGMYDNANGVFKVFIKDGKSQIARIK